MNEPQPFSRHALRDETMCPSAKEEYLKDILANITSDQAVCILKALWGKLSDVMTRP